MTNKNRVISLFMLLSVYPALAMENNNVQITEGINQDKKDEKITGQDEKTNEIGQRIYNAIHDLEELQNILKELTPTDENDATIKKALDIEINGLTPLEGAVYQGIPESVIDIVKLLLEHGAQAKNHPIVIYSLDRHKNPELAKLLLEAGLGNDLKDLKGDTSLAWSLKNCKEEYLDLLLKYHKKNTINIKVEVLEWAIENRDVGVIEFLLQHCDDEALEEILGKPNAITDKELPLVWAVKKDNVELVDLFSKYAPNKKLGSKASVRNITMGNHLILNAAIINGHYEIAKILIKNKTNCCKNHQHNDSTPLTYAVNMNQFELVNLILTRTR